MFNLSELQVVDVTSGYNATPFDGHWGWEQSNTSRVDEVRVEVVIRLEY